MKKYFAALLLMAVVGILLTSRAIEPLTETVPEPPLSVDDISLPIIERETYFLLPHVAETAWETPALLAETLDILEPGGAQGRVQVGAMMRVSIYDYLFSENGQWIVDTSGLVRQLEAAASIRRPIVIYLAGDHFASWTESLAELSRDPQNLMQVRGGGVLQETYFATPIVNASILVDKNLPVFRAKMQVLEAVAKVVAQFYKIHPELLAGVVLNGETHFLFKDFYSGTGVFKNAVLTDYSPLALQQFQQYLLANGEHQLQANDVALVDFNRFEHGVLPVEGWLDVANDRDLARVDDVFAQYSVNIYINGQHEAVITTSLNRLDVYQARSESKNPNVGFRYHWDFSQLPAGQYTIQATASGTNGKEFEIGKVTVTILNETGNAVSTTAAELKFPPLRRSPYVGHLDRPPAMEEVVYMPLARHWLEFREQVVVDHINFMSDLLGKHGIPADMMYSYQLTPWLVGGWNPVLFGVGDDFFLKTNPNPGVTLYGGNTLNTAVFNYLPEDKPYAIPEWHPQLDRSPLVPLASLYMHYQRGARFVAPYYLVTHDQWQNINYDPAANQDSHQRMLIAPGNPLMGSGHSYEAIKKIAEL